MNLININLLVPKIWLKLHNYQGVCQVREDRVVREKSGNSVFPKKVGEKTGILDKCQEKVREMF